MKVKIKFTEKQIQRYLQRVEKLILYNKIGLNTIKQNQRINNKSFYIMAFRSTRGGTQCMQYINNLRILENDILYCDVLERRKFLKSLLDSYIVLSPYKGEPLFNDYKKHYEEIFM